MTQHSNQIRTLITAGLYETNLLELLSLAKESFHQSPALYGTLISVFQLLIAEYNGQGFPTDRYEQIPQRLTKPLIEPPDPDSSSPIPFPYQFNTLPPSL